MYMYVYIYSLIWLSALTFLMAAPFYLEVFKVRCCDAMTLVGTSIIGQILAS